MTDAADSRPFALTVNGETHTVVAEPRMTLADVLRHKLKLTGTHVGCEQGVCGACTVLVDGAAVRSCLMLGVQAQGCDIRTIEALACGEQLHPLQKAFSEHHAMQCGYCTPGLLLSLVEFLGDNPDPTEDEIREAISGNLCRCTGYHNIVKAAVAAAKAMREAQAGTVR